MAAPNELVETLEGGRLQRPRHLHRPVIHPDQQERVRSYIEEGARLPTGGPQIPDGRECPMRWT